MGKDNAALLTTCRECGGSDLRWHCGHESTSGVVDGRLRMHDIKTIFFLGCESCSETLKTVSGDEVAQLLTKTWR